MITATVAQWVVLPNFQITHLNLLPTLKILVFARIDNKPMSMQATDSALVLDVEAVAVMGALTHASRTEGCTTLRHS